MRQHVKLLVPHLRLRAEKTHKIFGRRFLYVVKTTKSYKDTLKWFREYRRTGLHCEGCGALIFPCHPIGKVEDEYYHHGPSICSHEGAYWGHLDNVGNRVPAFGGSITAEKAVQEGYPPSATVPEYPSLANCTFVLIRVERLPR